MLTGKLVELSQGTIEPPSRFNQDLNDSWDQFLGKALASKADNRFVSAQEMRLVLDDVFNEWQTESAATCRWYEPKERDQPHFSRRPRANPRRVMFKDIRDALQLDELFRPHHFHRHQLQIVSSMVLYDPFTGLHWQRQGSGYTLDWHQAHRYVDYLNEHEFQGKTTWRLPTVEELLSVLRPPSVERDICLDPSFATTIHWLWSADHCNKKQAWMADILESYLGRQDLDGTASVCAVSN
jgi:serine/threonine-protein kinase